MNISKRISNLQRETHAALQRGNLIKAKKALEQLCKVDKQDGNAWFLLGTVHGALGNSTDSVRCCEKAVKLDPRNPDALFNLGISLQSLSRHQEAIKAFRRALELRSGFAEAFVNLGNSLYEIGETDAAVKCYIDAIRANPAMRQAYYNLGKTPVDSPYNEDVEGVLRNALAQNEKLAEAHLGLALLLYPKERVLEAIDHVRRAVELAPQWAQGYAVLGDLYAREREDAFAVRAFRKALELEPDSIPHRLALGRALLGLGRGADAAKLADEAYAKLPHNPKVIWAVAETRRNLGQFDEAIAFYRKLLEADPPRYAVYYSIAHVKKYDSANVEIAEIENLLSNSVGLDKETKSSLYFALGKIYGDMDNYDESFVNYLKANEIRRGLIEYDITDSEAEVDQIIQFFSAEFFESNLSSQIDTQLPVFVVGMPRSGTTLVETILGSHPKIYPAGELNEFRNISRYFAIQTGKPYPHWLEYADHAHLRSIGMQHIETLQSLDPHAARITDKMPQNFFYIGLIRSLYPKARIIHVKRNPVDTCLSIFFQSFNLRAHPYAHSLREAGLYYKEYEKLMCHWRKVISDPFLEIRYEDIVDNPEHVSRRLIDFADLPWDDRCLHFHEAERTVKTASSWQVRQPIYKTSKERWRRYERHLHPLLEALGVPHVDQHTT